MRKKVAIFAVAASVVVGSCVFATNSFATDQRSNMTMHSMSTDEMTALENGVELIHTAYGDFVRVKESAVADENAITHGSENVNENTLVIIDHGVFVKKQ